MTNKPKSFSEARDACARDFVISDECEIMDTISAHKTSFNNGFTAGARYILESEVIKRAIDDMYSNYASTVTKEVEKLINEVKAGE